MTSHSFSISHYLNLLVYLVELSLVAVQGDLSYRLRLVRVGAVTISWGKLFQSSTTMLEKKHCHGLVRECCFSSFREWSRSCLCKYVKKIGWLFLYKSCLHLNTWHRSIDLLVSSKLMGDSGGLVSLEYLLYTFSRLSISFLVCGVHVGSAYSRIGLTTACICVMWVSGLIHLSPVPHICTSESGPHWFR